jgi:hypothetical protein
MCNGKPGYEPTRKMNVFMKKIFAAKEKKQEVEMPVVRMSPPVGVQPKLMVGGADSAAEREADAVARNVVSSDGHTPAVSAIGSGSVQRIAAVLAGSGDKQAHPTVARHIGQTQQSGHPLDPGTRSWMEHRFDAQFDEVRIHDGSGDASAAQAIQAKAFTAGQHIYFNRGQYKPHHTEGKELIAHELTHTLQQGAGLQGAVQRDEEDASDDFDIDFEFLPPRLQLAFSVGMLDADTSRVMTTFTFDDFRTSLTYNYGGSIDLGFRYQLFSSTLGFNPSSEALSLSLGMPWLSLSGGYNLADESGTLGFRGRAGDFRYGGNFNLGTGAAGLNFGFGSELLPNFLDMTGTFNRAGSAAFPLLGSAGGIMNDPEAWYEAQQQQIEAISDGIGLLNKIREHPQTGIRFGGGVRLSYDPENRDFRIMGGLQGSF